MSSENPLQEAMRKFAIQDVFLCDSNVWSSRKIALGAPIKDPSVNFRLNENTECTVLDVDADSTKMFAIQYFVGTFVRVVAGPMPEGEPNEDQLVATIAATFLVRYLSETQPSEQMLQSFNDNAIHHAWPYWREYIESITTRLRVPTVVIPLRVTSGPSPAVIAPPEEKRPTPLDKVKSPPKAT